MRGERLRLAGFAGILVVAALRSLVAINPQLLFDVDPARDVLPALALGPVGSGVLDLVLLASAFAALAGEARAGRGIRPIPIFLAAAGSVAVFLHGVRDSVDAFRGGTWMAAMFALVALAHLVRERRLRIAALAVLAALAVPLAVRGAAQVTREHADTVAMFESTRESFFAERGWEPDSSAARTYERRLRQPEATGWFGLSNPYSSAMGAGLVGLGAIAVLGFRRGLAGPASLACAGALGCGTLLAVNGGKGAIAATALSAVVAVLVARGRLAPRAGIAVALAALVVLLVVARGFVGTAVGELSVLFRSFYLEAAARIVAANPVTGIGIDAVQGEFMRAKPAECPEDVTSIHSVFVDWLVSFGVFGAAWAATIALCMRGLVEAEPERERPGARAATTASASASASVLALRITALVAVAGLVLHARVEGPALDQTALVLRALGLMGMAVAAACVAKIAEELDGRQIAAVALALGVLALAHAQIELTAWHAGSCVLALSLVAVATALPRGGVSGLPARAALAMPLLALALPAMSVVRERSLSAELERAADTVRPLAEVRSAYQRVAASRARGEATDARPLVEAVALAADDERTAAVVAALRADDAEAVKAQLVALDGALRRACAAILVRAAESHPSSRVPREAAIKQLANSGRRAVGVRSAAIVDRAAFDEARAQAALFAAEEPSFRAYALASDLAVEDLRRAIASRDASDISERAAEAVRWARLASDAQPYGARRKADLGDALLASGDAAAAAKAYEEAIAQDDLSRLDPLAQLSTRERRTVAASLERARSAPSRAQP